MAPIHTAVTRRHFLRAFGVAAVALALPAPEPVQAPAWKPVTMRPPSNGWFEGFPLKVGDVIEIEGVYLPSGDRREFVVTQVASGPSVTLAPWP